MAGRRGGGSSAVTCEQLLFDFGGMRANSAARVFRVIMPALGVPVWRLPEIAGETRRRLA
jgi:hypothetical protein